MDNQITFGSLFAGIGGFDLGFESCGMKCKWQVEIDDYATRILERHWPGVYRERDIKQCGRHNLAAVDVICGGFPCQDISYAGKGAGLDGERSGLFFEAIRLVRELRPRAVVLENVAGLLTRGLDRVLGTLAEIGFDAEWHCIPAASVGAPHIRDRVFILAYRNCESNGSVHAEVAELPDDRNANCDDAGAERSIQKRQNTEPSGGGVLADTTRKRKRPRPKSGRNVGRQVKLEGTRPRRKADDCGEAGNGANTHSPRLEGQRQITCRTFQEFRDAGDRGWWAVEPDVGGIINGFSRWLDGNTGLITQSHKRIMAYVINQHGDCNGNAQKERAEQVLQDLRNRFSSQGVQWTAGGLVSVSSQEVLFAYLCKHTVKTANEAWIQLQSKKVSEVGLRSLRSRQELASSPCGSGQEQQCAGKYPDSLQTLSRFLAQDARKAWMGYCGKNASPVLSEWGPGWEAGTLRVAHGVPNRVDRLRCLGNAIVPQVAEVVGRILLERLEVR